MRWDGSLPTQVASRVHTRMRSRVAQGPRVSLRMALMALLAIAGFGALAGAAQASGCTSSCAHASSPLSADGLDVSQFTPASDNEITRPLAGATRAVKSMLTVIEGGPTSVDIEQARQAEVRAPVGFRAIASGGKVFGGGTPSGFTYQYAVYTAAEYAKDGAPIAADESQECSYGVSCEFEIPAEISYEPGKYFLETPGQYVVTFNAVPEGNTNNGVTEYGPITVTVQPRLAGAKIVATQNGNAPAGDVLAGSLQTLTASAEDGAPPYTYTWEAAGGTGDQILQPSSAESITELFADEEEGAAGVKVFVPENERYGVKNTPVDETTGVTITDADGVSVEASNVTGKILADEMKVSIMPPSSTIYATAGATFSASTTGGVSPYTYTWSISKDAAPAPASSFTTVGSGQSVNIAFPSSETVQRYIVSVDAQDSGQPYSQGYVQGTEVVVQPTPKIKEATQVSCAEGGKAQVVTFKLPAITQAEGCFTEGKSSSGASTYSSTGTVRIDDLPITPNATIGPIVLTAPSKSHPGGSLSVPDAAVALGLPSGKVAQVIQGKLELGLPSLKEGETSGEGKLASLESSKGVSLFGFKIAGGVSLSFVLNGKGQYSSSVALNLDLPSVFKNGPPDGSNPPGGVSGEVHIKVVGSGPVFEGLHFDVENAYIGNLTVNELCLTLIPGDSGFKSACVPKDASFTSPSSQVIEGCGSTNLNPSVDTWTADASISLPKPLTASIGIFGGGETGSDGATKIDYLGGEGSHLGIPLFEGVDLEKLGAGVCFNPLKITGQVGVGLMPVDGNDAVVLTGALTYVAGEPFTPATGTSAAIPAKPWNLNFKGEVEVFKQEVGNGEIDVDQDGDFNFGVNLKFAVGSYVTLSGGVSGWVEPQYKLFNVNGHIMIAVSIAGVKASAQAEGVVSSSGAAGCIGVSLGSQTISAGAGMLWNQSPNVMFGSCSIGAYEAAQAASVAGAGGPKALTLPSGLPGVALRIAGTTGPPRVLITGPGGRRIESPASAPLALVKGRYLLMEDPTHKATDVLIVAPKAGRYTISSLTPGDQIASLGTGRVLPSFKGHGRVLGHGARRTLRLRYSLPAGSKLTLVERGAHIVHTIARDVQGKQCGHKTLCFTTRFTPARGVGGARKIEAEVQRGGLPLPPIVVAQYKASALKLPGVPRKAQLLRKGTAVILRWTGAGESSQYSVLATTTLGRQTRLTLPGSCRAVKIGEVPAGVGLSARIEGVRFDGTAGPARKLSIKPGHRHGGAKGKALPGKLCA